MGVSINGKKWGYPQMDGLFQRKCHLEMDDNWGYPYLWKPSYPGG